MMIDESIIRERLEKLSLADLATIQQSLSLQVMDVSGALIVANKSGPPSQKDRLLLVEAQEEAIARHTIVKNIYWTRLEAIFENE